MNTLLRHSIVKYALVGLLGTAVHWGLLVALVEGTGVHPVAGSALGFIAVLIMSYILNSRWTFRGSGKVMDIKQFLRYSIVSCSGLLINTAVMYASVELMSLPYWLGQAAVTIVVPLHNYAANRVWTFREQTAPELAHDKNQS